MLENDMYWEKGKRMVNDGHDGMCETKPIATKY